MTNEIKQLNDHELKALINRNETEKTIVIIDIREPDEYQREHIPGSRNIPLAQLPQTDFSKEKDKLVIFHCRLGNRTRTSQSSLANTGFKKIYCMQGGIEQWKNCGLPVEKNTKAPLEIMRQVQIAAGSLVLLGILLAYLASPYFIILSAFVGAGLIMAGITGFCGMAKLLMLLPWNKP